MTTRFRFACWCLASWLALAVTATRGDAQTLPRWTAHTSLTALLNAEKTRLANLPLNTFKPLTADEVTATGHALTWLFAGSLDGQSTLESLGYVLYTFDPANGKRYTCSASRAAWGFAALAWW